MSAEDDAAAKAAADKAEADAKAAEEAKAKAKAEADEMAKLGEAGKRALDAEREARSAAEKKAKDAEKELAALRKQAEEAEAAKAKAAEEDAEKKGEFERLANERAEKIKAATEERDALQARLDKVFEVLKPGVDESWKALPAEISSMYDGDQEDILAKSAFLTKSKPLVDAFKATNDPTKPRPPMSPRPNGDGTNDAEARAQQARSYRDW
jgi:hypothetical protein